jgi:hypothetical protein
MVVFGENGKWGGNVVGVSFKLKGHLLAGL